MLLLLSTPNITTKLTNKKLAGFYANAMIALDVEKNDEYNEHTQATFVEFLAACCVKLLTDSSVTYLFL